MKLYVGNLSFQTTEQDLSALFASHGNVQEIKIPVDHDTQRPRGFAFVTMEDVRSAQAAIGALDGTAFQGRNLTVNESKPKEGREFSGGRRYR